MRVVLEKPGVENIDALENHLRNAVGSGGVEGGSGEARRRELPGEAGGGGGKWGRFWRDEA